MEKKFKNIIPKMLKHVREEYNKNHTSYKIGKI